MQVCILYNFMFTQLSILLWTERGSFHMMRAESFQSYLKPPHLLFEYMATEQLSEEHEYQKF